MVYPRGYTPGKYLKATMLRIAETASRFPPDPEDDVLVFKSMGLDSEIICKIAPTIHESVRAVGISELVLDHNPIGARGARALFGNKDVLWIFLVKLSLSNTTLGSGFSCLMDAIENKRMPDLEKLHLSNVDIDDADARRMWVVLPKLRMLRELDLSHNLFGLEGLTPLERPMEREWFPKLKQLDLGNITSLEHCVASDKIVTRAVLNKRFPMLNTCSFPVTWQGLPRALEIFYRERSGRKRRENMERWMNDEASSYPPPGRVRRDWHNSD